MLRLTIKNLLANRLRFALTTFAVVLAVAFVVSSFVLTDGLRSSFNALSGEIVGGTDFEIRPVEEFGTPDRLDDAVLEAASQVDGVASAAPLVATDGDVLPINTAGEAISTQGPPIFAFGWIEDSRLSGLTLVEGSAPSGPGEFTMDTSAADAHGFEVGETYDVSTPTGMIEHTLTGLVRFGENNDTLGATLMQFDLPSLQQMANLDGYESVLIALDNNTDRAAVEAKLVAIDPNTTVVDNATLESEQRAEFNDGISIIGNVLLGFAGISLFVSIFIIYNTFSIVLSQRTKELALLRTVGADRKQLSRSVLGEASVIGVLASAIGIGAGVGVALGLRGLFGLLGAQLPDSPIVVSIRTVIVAIAVGVGITLISSIGPARKASRVSPIAALRDGAAAGEVSGRVRFSIGAGLALIGLISGGLGLFVASSATSIVAMLAIGAIGVFVGITLLSPVVAEPLTRFLGWPARRVFGVSGRLAQQNAGRNPQRTATTAAALMIGLAMVSMALTVGESLKADLRSALNSTVTADYLATADNSGFPTTIASDIDDLPETSTVTSFRYAGGEIDGVVTDIVGTDFDKTPTLFDLDITEGVAADADVADPVLISNERAEADLIAVGDSVSMKFSSGESRELTVIGVFDDDVVIQEDFLLDFSTWSVMNPDATDAWVAFALAEGVSAEQADQALASLASTYPLVNVETTNSFVEGTEGDVDQTLAAVNVMVALAVIIALVGIANTLALSVFERTRELGLLRAVGMTRRQLRRMVRFEAGLVALFGATLGVTIGVLFGWAAVTALPSDFTSTLAVPVLRILILVALAGTAGLLAAWGPARRAGKLDVLEAISS